MRTSANSRASADPSSPTIPAESSLRLDRYDFALTVLLLLGLCGMFWRMIFTSDMPFFRDVFNHTYPHARFIQESVRNGSLPYWNPYLNYGQPLLANPNFLFFYPYTLFIILLPIDFAYKMHYVVHFALAAVGTYLLARQWAQSRAAAFFAASVFAFSGPVLSLGNLYNHAACVAWIPWALLFTERALRSRSVRPWILLTAVFALQFLASEPFTLLATFGLCFAYSLIQSGALRQPLVARGRRLVGAFFAVGCAVVALGAIQFLPSLDLLTNSFRGVRGLPFKETTYWSFHPFSLIELVVPEFFSPWWDTPTTWSIVLSCRNKPYFVSVFVGFVPLFFALAGWALSDQKRRGFAAWSALTLLALSFGQFAPFFALAYLLIPPLTLVRFPIKLLVPALLLVALLAGWGLDALRQPHAITGQQRKRILGPLGLLLVCAAFLWLLAWFSPDSICLPGGWILLLTNELFARHPAAVLSTGDVLEATRYLVTSIKLYMPGLAGYALGAVLLVMAWERRKRWVRRALPVVVLFALAQLVVFNYAANPTVPKSFYTYRPPVLDHFRDADQPYRFCYSHRLRYPPSPELQTQTYLNFESIPEIAHLPYLAQVSFRDRLLLARGTMLTRIEGTSSDDVELAFPPFLHEFWVFTLGQMTDATRAYCLLGRTNVKYLLARLESASPVLRPLAEVFNGSAEPSYLYENLCALPRAYVANRSSFSTNSLETLTRLSALDFDASNEVILAASPGAAPWVEGGGRAGSVEILERHPNLVRLRAELTRPAYVVLLDRFDSNWKASVDGRETQVWRANQLFRAVHVQAGRHEITYSYRRRGLIAAACISVVAFMGLATLWWVDPLSRPQAPA